MAVFVSASDEGSGANHLCPFEITGWIAPEQDWSRFFVPAWDERVLAGPPRIPYLHVTDMRSKAWREKHGLTKLDSDTRLDEASKVIETLGSLYPLRIAIDGGLFRHLYDPHRLKAQTGAIKRFEPDYYTYCIYIYATLKRVKIRHPDAEKVDFVVERKSGITNYIRDFYDAMPEALRYIGEPELLPLLGELIPASKDRVPLQAADFLCWHSQRAGAESLTAEDMPRWQRISSKHGLTLDVPHEALIKLAEAFDKHGETHERAFRVRQVQRHDAKANKSSARDDKSQTGSGEGSEKAEA